MVSPPDVASARTVKSDEFEAELLNKLKDKMLSRLPAQGSKRAAMIRITRGRLRLGKSRSDSLKTLKEALTVGTPAGSLSTEKAEQPTNRGFVKRKMPAKRLYRPAPAVPNKFSLPDLAQAVHQVVDEMVRDGDKTIIEGLDPAVTALLGPISSIIKDVQQKTSEENIRKLVEVLLPSHDPVAAVRASIDQDNAEARVRFIQSVPCYTNAELAQFVGHSAKNKSATGSRWKTDGKVFSVTVKGTERYPAFQFKDGRPLPVIADILAALPEGMSPWQIAFWFVSSNRWLDGKSPTDLLDDGEAVVHAARAEGDAVVG